MTAELESMFYYGETPWHKLGKEVPNALTAQEAIVAAGLDWDVEKVNLFTNFKGSKVKVEGKQAIRRQTDGHVLGIMTPQYTPVQNRDAFKFFDSVTGTGEAKYHTAGSLRDGKRIWMLAKLDKNGPINIKGDAIDKFLLLMNSHDGGTSLKMFFTPIRVVCMNTLSMAESGAGKAETFKSTHLGNIYKRMDAAREILVMCTKYYENFEVQANRLAQLQLPPGDLPKLLVAAFGTTGSIRPEDAVDLSMFSPQKKTEMEHVINLFEGAGKGLGRDGIRGTKWAAYNSIVEHIDYGKQVNKRSKSPEDTRLEIAWNWGTPIKNRAWDFLTKS